MDTLSIRTRYRPIRIGWCVRTGDFEALRDAVRMSYTMWGGRYNPIISVDSSALAEQMVRLFRVDVLWPMSKDDTVKKFIEQFPHLSNPLHHDDLFVQYSEGSRSPQIADIYHPIRQCFEDNFKNNAKPDLRITIYEWQPVDPLADVFLITFGGVPPPAITGIDYGSLLREYLHADTVSTETESALVRRDERGDSVMVSARISETALLGKESLGSSRVLHWECGKF